MRRAAAHSYQSLNKVDEQIRNRCVYDFDGCNHVALAVFSGKLICGLCYLKIENKIKEHRRKMLETIEEELKNDRNS